MALAVLTGSAAILAQMVDLGARHAERATKISEAQEIAHNLMLEFVTGQRPWEPSETFQPVDLWSPWDYQMSVQPIGLGKLVSIRVTVVERQLDASGPVASPELTTAPVDSVDTRKRYHLVRWVRHELPTETAFDTSTGSDTPLVTEP